MCRAPELPSKPADSRAEGIQQWDKNRRVWFPGAAGPLAFRLLLQRSPQEWFQPWQELQAALGCVTRFVLVLNNESKRIGDSSASHLTQIPSLLLDTFQSDALYRLLH